MTSRTYIFPVPPPQSSYYGRRVFQKSNRLIPATYISNRGREFRDWVYDCATRQHPDAGVISGRCSVDVIVHLKSLTKYDLDNRLKSLLDAVTACGRIWHDDSQVDDLRIRRGQKSPPHGVCFFTIKATDAPLPGVD